MRGYEKDTDVAAEIAAMREAFARVAAAIRAAPDAEQAFRDANTIGELAKKWGSGAADLRAEAAARLADTTTMSIGDLAKMFGMTRSRVAQLVTLGRKKEITVTDPGTQPEPLSVAAAVITSEHGLLVARRHDRIPPWTFPATEIEPGESPASAVKRAVLKETGLTAAVDHVIGKRIHPKTGRLLIYMDVSVNGADVRTDDPDLAEVRWIDLAEADQLMGDMFPVVRQHIGRVLGSA